MEALGRVGGGQKISRAGGQRRAEDRPARGRRKKSLPARVKEARQRRRVLCVVVAGGLAAAVAVLALAGPRPAAHSDVAESAPPVNAQHSPGFRVEATAVITADSGAIVSFSRAAVRSLPRDGKGVLNVASAGMARPPAGSLMAPLEVLVQSSPFGLRTSPITGVAGEFHWGQDYSSPCGTRVYSADAGVVRAVGWHQWGGGNRVELDHGNGLITTYNHLEAIAVKAGEPVRVGQVIARVGTTGSSTGCHLHFETILNGTHTNPGNWVLLPTRQADELGSIEMTNYAPAPGKPVTEAPVWAVPVTAEHSHVIDGSHEPPTPTPAPGIALPEAPVTATPSTTPVAPPLSPETTPPVDPAPAVSQPTQDPTTAPTQPTPTTPPPETPTPAEPSQTPTVQPTSSTDPIPGLATTQTP